MKALIIAGGFGTRLRPLTCTTPKHLFPIGGKPLLDWTMERLAKSGVDEVILAVSYMREAFFERYKKSAYGMKVHYSHEVKPLGTGGCIKNAEKTIGRDTPFLVLNGDILSSIDYAKLVVQHKKNDGLATIALRRVDDPSRYGVVEIAPNNRIDCFIEKPKSGKAPSNLINAGVYAMDPEILSYIQTERRISIEREIFPRLAKDGILYGFEFGGLWIDMGEPVDYLKGNRLLLDAEFKSSKIARNVKIEGNVQVHNPVVIDEGAHLSDKAQLGPYVTISSNVSVGKGVFLEDCIVFSDAVISDFSHVRGALIGRGAFVGSHVKIEDNCIIGDYVVIHDKVTLSKGVTVCPQKEVTESVLKPRCIM